MSDIQDPITGGDLSILGGDLTAGANLAVDRPAIDPPANPPSWANLRPCVAYTPNRPQPETVFSGVLGITVFPCCTCGVPYLLHQKGA